jgi:hypothetical protein
MKITTDLMLSWNPCYGQEESRKKWLRAFPSGAATPLEVAKTHKLPAGDRLWALLREGVLPDVLLREFAADCAHRALELYGSGLTDDRLADCYGAAGLAALEAAGAEISQEDRAAAGDAAWAAAGAAAGDAAWAAAGAAAGDAAGDAAWAAARAAARAASWAAAGDAESRIQVAHLADLIELAASANEVLPDAKVAAKEAGNG